MKVGMIARGEDRGLGNLLREFYRHMRPDKTLLVVPEGAQKAGLQTHVDWFEGATPIRFGRKYPGSLGVGDLDEKMCRAFLDGLDVVLSAETFYDWRICQWAEEMGVATVCWVMPEFARPEWFNQPTVIWAPTRYRLHALPESTRVVPVPIPVDRFASVEFLTARAPVDEQLDRRPLQWLHVHGAQSAATHDRNGTGALLRALRFLKEPATVMITAQTPLDVSVDIPAHVDLHVENHSFRDYWMVYSLGTALVLPRRFAGLCLPALEAMGAGLAVLMSDMEPQNSEWPVSTVPTRPGTPLRLIGGEIETTETVALSLAERMDAWATDPTRFEDACHRSVEYAAEHSWRALRPMILDELEMACEQLHR